MRKVQKMYSMNSMSWIPTPNPSSSGTVLISNGSNDVRWQAVWGIAGETVKAGDTVTIHPANGPLVISGGRMGNPNIDWLDRRVREMRVRL